MSMGNAKVGAMPPRVRTSKVRQFHVACKYLSGIMKTEWREGIGVEVLNLLGFIALFDNRAPNNRALENDHCVFDLIPIRILDTARIPAQ